MSAMAIVLWTMMLLIPVAVADGGGLKESKLFGTMVFSTVGRPEYAFDVFAVSLPLKAGSLQEIQLTDGLSVNHNAQFHENYNWGPGLLGSLVAGRAGRPSGGDILSYVSERDGSARIYFNVFVEKEEAAAEQSLQDGRIREVVDNHKRERKVVTLPLSSLTRPRKKAELLGSVVDQEKIALHDRPVIANGTVYFISTREPAERLLQSWTALYSTSLATGKTHRLTPCGVVDYSPAVSPSGKWIIVASKQGKEYHRETSEMELDLYILNAEDGSNRRLLVSNGGWPTWKDESTVLFHRVADDGWWSIFKLSLPSNLAGPVPVLEAERVTPSGVHAFTPAASLTGNWLAVATRRPQVSSFRHIEIFDLDDRSFTKVTELIHATDNHYNPFITSSSNTLGYHRCRGSSDEAVHHAVTPHPAASIHPRLERIESTLSDLTLLRSDGDFPAISSDGSVIAYIPELSDKSGLYVMNRDGTGRTKLFTGLVFGTSWDRKRPGRVYTSYGGTFAKAYVPVQVIAVSFDEEAFRSGGDLKVSHQVLSAEGTGNNAFPAASPDGREIVFRSGRSGDKNLYIMDADGEVNGIRQLTDGAWTDTMPNWSPDGEWIAFSSDRDFPDSGHFAIYLVRPDGRDLHRLLPLVEGRMNHPVFSPDTKNLLFTCELAGNSAEPISTAHQFQPYGELYVVALDGTNLQRLTHNAYEDGTPTWGGRQENVSEGGSEVACGFYDVTWLTNPLKVGSNRIC